MYYFPLNRAFLWIGADDKIKEEVKKDDGTTDTDDAGTPKTTEKVVGNTVRKFNVQNFSYEISRKLTDHTLAQYETPICTKLEFEIIAMGKDESDTFFFQRWMYGKESYSCNLEIFMTRDGDTFSKRALYFDDVFPVEITDVFCYPEKDSYQMRRKILLSGGKFKFGDRIMEEDKDEQGNTKKDDNGNVLKRETKGSKFRIVLKEDTGGDKEK